MAVTSVGKPLSRVWVANGDEHEGTDGSDTEEAGYLLVTYRYNRAEEYFAVLRREIDDWSWYHVIPVIASVNRILDGCRHKERFTTGFPSGQFSNYLFAEPLALRKLVEDFCLPSGCPPNPALQVYRVREAILEEAK